MANLAKEKLSDDIQMNFNHSREVAYWAKKYNVSPQLFQKAFKESGYSIPKTLQFFNHKFNNAN